MIERQIFHKKRFTVSPGKEGASINVAVRVMLPKQKVGIICTVMHLIDKGGNLEGELQLSLDDALVPLMQVAEAELRAKEKALQIYNEYIESRRTPKPKKPKRKKRKPTAKPVHRARPVRIKKRVRSRQTGIAAPAAPIVQRDVNEQEGYDELNIAELPEWEREMIKLKKQEKQEGASKVQPSTGQRIFLPPPKERDLSPSRRAMKENRPAWK